MKKIEQYLKNIYSDNADIAVSSVYELGALKSDEALHSLTFLLQTTDSPNIRNAAAMALADMGDQRTLPFLISLISDPKTENYHGTLVHALQYFDCSGILSFLVDLVINGNFEVSHEAFQAIENIDGEVDENEFETCLNKIEESAHLCQSEEKKELSEALKEIFLENESERIIGAEYRSAGQDRPLAEEICF